MKKYAKIEIESAKFPLKIKGDSTDYINLEERKESEKIQMPKKKTDLITIHQVSAMVHCMLGSRPISYHRKSEYSQSEKIYSTVTESLVRVNNEFMYENNKGETKVYIEFTQAQKSHYNSTKKNCTTQLENGKIIKGNITWDSLKRKVYYRNPSLYNEIIEFFNSICDDKSLFKTKNLADFMLFLSQDEDKKNKMIEFFKSKSGMTALVNLLVEDLNNIKYGFEVSPIVQYNLATKTVVRSVKGMVSLDATILIPVDDEMRKEFMKSKRFATFGDGGVAHFVGIVNEDDLFKEKNYVKIEE